MSVPISSVKSLWYATTTPPAMVMTMPTVSPLLSLSPRNIIPRRSENSVWAFIRNDVSGMPMVFIDDIQSAAPMAVSTEV